MEKHYKIVADKPHADAVKVYDPDGKEVENVLSVEIDPIVPDEPITATIKVPVSLNLEVVDRSDLVTENFDIVYFVKDTLFNEELRYSLRTVERNFPHASVVFAGGNPKRISPDRHITYNQGHGRTKWDNVSSMIRHICRDSRISAQFFLFNDDFFILKPVKTWTRNFYDGTLADLQNRIVKNNNDSISRYVERLQTGEELLREHGYGTKNFELHCPMKIDKNKMLALLDEFGEDAPCKRSLYGNKYFDDEGGIEMRDNKIALEVGVANSNDWFVSTLDKSFERGQIGRQIRGIFTEPSRFEKEVR